MKNYRFNYKIIQDQKCDQYVYLLMHPLYVVRQFCESAHHYVTIDIGKNTMVAALFTCCR